jgi:exodeoxyribonuclease V alpha subunit
MIEIQDELPLDVRPDWSQWLLQANALERQVIRSLRALGVVEVVQQAVALLLQAQANGQLYLRCDPALLAGSPFRTASFTDWQRQLEHATGYQKIAAIDVPLLGSATIVVQWQDFLMLHRGLQVLHVLRTEVQDRIDALSNRSTALTIASLPASLPGIDADTEAHIARALDILQHDQLLFIAGGPGTGKTTLAAKLVLALSQQAAWQHQPALRIALIAPTGRAAARLAQVWQAELAKLLDHTAATADLRRMIQRIGGDAASAAQILRVGTVHKLWSPGKDLQHGEAGDSRAARSVYADVIVIDESSMLSLELINLILTGCNRDAKLIFLGDPGQLPALDLGAPFFDLLKNFADTNGLLLTKQWRSDDKLQTLAQSIQAIEHAKQAGLAEQNTALVEPNSFVEQAVNAAMDQLSRYQAPFQSSTAMLQQLIGLGAFDRIMHAATPAQALSAALQLKLLTLTRTGANGQLPINAQLEALLVKHYRHESMHRYRGRVLIATKNRYALNVMNGDMGVVFPDDQRQWKVWFEQQGVMQAFDLDLFDDLEPAFAITVHKAQGSEFDSVILLLPETEASSQYSADARLVYTALTRAKKGFRWLGHKSVLATLIASFDARGATPPGFWSATGTNQP